jgi:hypothetical protein
MIAPVGIGIAAGIANRNQLCERNKTIKRPTPARDCDTGSDVT